MYNFKAKNRLYKAVMLITDITFGVGFIFKTGWSNNNFHNQRFKSMDREI